MKRKKSTSGAERSIVRKQRQEQESGRMEKKKRGRTKREKMKEKQVLKETVETYVGAKLAMRDPIESIREVYEAVNN